MKVRVVFEYDYRDRRTSKTVSRWQAGAWQVDSVTKFVWAGWLLIAETDGQGQLLRSYAWGQHLGGGVGGLLSVTDHTRGGAAGLLYYASRDGNGNVTALVDAATGATVAAYEYAPGGQPINIDTLDAAAADVSRFLFSTKYLDAEIGLYYYGYRYYDPATGRWISRDPLAEEGGLNLYAFCRNDPLGLIDPLGLTEAERAYWQAIADRCPSDMPKITYKVVEVREMRQDGIFQRPTLFTRPALQAAPTPEESNQRLLWHMRLDLLALIDANRRSEELWKERGPGDKEQESLWAREQDLRKRVQTDWGIDCGLAFHGTDGIRNWLKVMKQYNPRFGPYSTEQYLVAPGQAPPIGGPDRRAFVVERPFWGLSGSFMAYTTAVVIGKTTRDSILDDRPEGRHQEDDDTVNRTVVKETTIRNPAERDKYYNDRVAARQRNVDAASARAAAGRKGIEAADAVLTEAMEGRKKIRFEGWQSGDRAGFTVSEEVLEEGRYQWNRIKDPRLAKELLEAWTKIDFSGQF